MSTYYNRTTNDGVFGSFQADPDQADIPIYARCKFVSNVSSDGQAMLQVAGLTEAADVVAMQPIVAGKWGTVKFMNAPGTQFGNVTEAVSPGDTLYSAASGNLSKSSGSFAVIQGKVVVGAQASRVCVYAPIAGAA
jgi:hypothetical protein